tara:strand:+ start:274 stop:450 length:177 start_codon:yes stop_codon:yes gene_type:complete
MGLEDKKEFNKALNEVRTKISKLLDDTFNMYGQGDYTPQVTSQIIKIVRAFGEKIKRE